MTRLFRELQSAPQSSNTNDFINQASKQGFGMNVQDFMRFAEMAKGKDMCAVVQELRSNGAIDDKMFSDLQRKASGFMNLIKMFGK